MKLFFYFLIPAFVFISLTNACTETTIDSELKPASDYYPLTIGKYIVYNLDSVIFNESIEDAFSHWEIKELVADTFTSINGELLYRIERFKRKDASFPWVLEYVWSVQVVDEKIHKTENNLQFIKLVSPVENQVKWDGTIYLGDLDSIPVERYCDNYKFLENWEYQYFGKDSIIELNGLQFENTISVYQLGADNFIENNFAIETFSKGIGLIKKEFYHYTDDDFDCIECAWEDHVECGYKFTLEILEYN